MKKGTNAKSTKKDAGKKEAPARVTLAFLTVSEVMNGMVESENKVEFNLVAPTDGNPAATLTIYPSDKDFDNAILNLFGFSIRVIIRAGKSGMFLSFPSQKGKDGNYYDLVTCYDKNFHSLIKEVLAAYYNDDEETD